MFLVLKYFTSLAFLIEFKIIIKKLRSIKMLCILFSDSKLNDWWNTEIKTDKANIFIGKNVRKWVLKNQIVSCTV